MKKNIRIGDFVLQKGERDIALARKVVKITQQKSVYGKNLSYRILTLHSPVGTYGIDERTVKTAYRAI